MKPTCKLCETRHWTYEEHAITSALEKTQKLGAGVLARMGVHQGPPSQLPGPVNKRTEINKRTNKRTVGRPKKWASESERLKAYRERSKG